MASWGVTTTGFITPSYQEVLDEIEVQLRREPPDGFGPELDFSFGSPIYQMASVWAEMLSNKGLAGSQITALWPKLRSAFFNTFRDFAEDISLDYVGQYRDAPRRDDKKATGFIIFEGTAGDNVPLGAQVAKTSDVTKIVQTTKALDIGAGGEVAIPVEAVATGAGHNAAAYTYSTVLGNLGSVTASNKNAQDTFIVGSGSPDGYVTLTNDSGTANYFNLTVSDLLYFVNLEAVRFWVRNPSSSKRAYYTQWIFIDPATGDVIEQAAVEFFELDGGEAKEHESLSLSTDLSGYTNVRAVLINHTNSDGDLEVGYKTVVSGGGLYLNGVQQATKDLFSEWDTIIDGEIGNGQDQENGKDYRERLKKILFNAAGGTPNGLFSKLFMLDGVLGVKIYPNSADAERTVVSGVVVPAKTFATYVDGGDRDEIGLAIAKSGNGLQSRGDVTVNVTLDSGVEPIQFSYAERVRPVIKVKLTRTGSFPDGDGNTQVKDEIIKYLSGFDSKGAKKTGLDIGEDISHGHVVDAVLNVPGIRFAEVLIGATSSTLIEHDFPILGHQRAWGDSTKIQVI